MFTIDFTTLHQKGGNPNEFTVIARDGENHIHLRFNGEIVRAEIEAALANPNF